MSFQRKGSKRIPKKTEAVKTYPIPVNVKKLRAFLGLVGFYRKFIQNFGNIASPLHKLMQKEKRFQWTTECQQAFEKLKERLMCAPILGFPNERDIFTLCTDASLTGIGAVLSQNQNNAGKVIAYASKSVQKGQHNYSATKRELYAVVFFTNYFKEYLLRIVTDYRALVWLYSFKDPDGLVARWLEKLSSFDFEIVHRPGTSISHADALSRIPPSSLLFEPVTVSAVNTQSARDNDGILVEYIIPSVIEWVPVGETPPRNSLFGEPRDLRCYWNQFQSLQLRDSKLYRRMENSDGSTAGFQFCIDRADVPEILRMSHDVPSGGHMGVSKTLACVRSRYYWPSIKTDVENWVSGCATCQKGKNPKQKYRHSMQIWPNSEPFHHVSVDILGPLPESNGFRYIVMMGDNFTRWFEAVPLVNVTAVSVCNALLDSWVTLYGVPDYIHSDNCPQFTSSLFKNMCERLQLTQTRTTPYHPQGNAKAERINRTLEDGLAKYCGENHSTWLSHIQFFMMAYRNAVHESTGHTPFRLLFNLEMQLPVDMVYPTALQRSPSASYRDYIHERLLIAEQLFTLVRHKCLTEHRRHKHIYDKKIYGPTFMEGDRVLLHSPVCHPGQTPKLKSQWSGPYVIDRCINDINFVLRHEINGKRTIAHYDRINCFEETRSSRPLTPTSSHPTTVETSNRSPPTSTPPLLNCSSEPPSSD